MTVRNYNQNKETGYYADYGFPYIVTLHKPPNTEFDHVNIGKSCDFPHRRLFNTYYFQSEADRTMFILKWS